MFTKFKKFFSEGNPYIFMGIVFAFLIFAFYVILGRDALNSLVEQTLHRQQLSARSGASSLKVFFDLLGKSLITLSQNPDLKHYDDKTSLALNSFVDNWEGSPLTGVILTDKKGIVAMNANRLGVPFDIVDVSDRDYFIWGKDAKKGEYFVGKPVVSRTAASKGQYIITVATPVFDGNNEFLGVITAAVSVTDVGGVILDPVKLSDITMIYLVNDKGDIFYSPVPEFLGVNYFEYLEKNPFLGSSVITKMFRDRLGSSEEDKLDIHLPDAKTGTLRRYLIASAPVAFSSWHGTLVIVSPMKEALSFLAPAYIRQIEILIVSFMLMLVVAIRFTRAVEHKKHGIEDGS